MVIVKDTGEIYDPNKQEVLRLSDADRRTISQFAHELVSPFRSDVHPTEDDARIAEIEFAAAMHALGEKPNMQAARVIELATAGALQNLDDAKKLFDAATEAMDDRQKETLELVWGATYDARARLPHATTEIEEGSTYSAMSRLVDSYALQNMDDRRLGTYLAAFASGLTRKSQFGAMHVDQLDSFLEPR